MNDKDAAAFAVKLTDTSHPVGSEVRVRAGRDDYLAENPGPIQLKYGTTVSAINAQVAELLDRRYEDLFPAVID